MFLTRREEYEAKAEQMLTPLMEEHGFELVDVEYVKEAGTWYLRGYIDKPGGITVNDCEDVSRAFSDILDEQDFKILDFDGNVVKEAKLSQPYAQKH